MFGAILGKYFVSLNYTKVNFAKKVIQNAKTSRIEKECIETFVKLGGLGLCPGSNGVAG